MAKMKLYAFLTTLICVVAAVQVQACCSATGIVGMLDGNQLNPTVFDHAGLPLTPIFQCILNSQYYTDGLSPKSWMRDCNFFGCNCNHCYGYDDNCQGTDDYPGAADYGERFVVVWWNQGVLLHHLPSTAVYGSFFKDCRAELEPYLKCPARTTAERESRACADKHILDEAPDALEARLTTQFCEPGGKLVGRAFLDQMLATLDANRDGSVSCAEWGMAKRTSTLEDLGGAYHGPRSITPPECPMTPEGTEALARYNAYFGELTSATMAAAAARAAADEASRGGVAAAAPAEGR